MDRLEVCFLSDGVSKTPLASFQLLDREADEDLLKKSLLCRKLLLQAGADPTLGIIDNVNAHESRSAIHTALGSSNGGRRITVILQMPKVIWSCRATNLA